MPSMNVASIRPSTTQQRANVQDTGQLRDAPRMPRGGWRGQRGGQAPGAGIDLTTVLAAGGDPLLSFGLAPGGRGRGRGSRGRGTFDAGRGSPRGGRGRGSDAGPAGGDRGGRGRGRGGRGRGGPFRFTDMHQQAFNYGPQDTAATDTQISAYVRTSIASVTSASPHQSGSSTPRRGYPARQQPGRGAAGPAHHGGLGYHSLTSMEDAASAQPSHYGYERSGRGSGRGGSGMSNSKLLIPVTFIAATGKTGLEGDEAQRTDPAIKAEVGQQNIPPPTIMASRPPSNRPPPGPKALENGCFFPAPPEFATMRDIGEFWSGSASPKPDTPRMDVDRTQKEGASVAAEDSQASAAVAVEVIEQVLVTESVSAGVPQDRALADETQTTPMPLSPPGLAGAEGHHVETKAAPGPLPVVDGPAFVIDVEGDRSLAEAGPRPSASDAGLFRTPLGAEPDSDEDEDVVVFKPPASTRNGNQTTTATAPFARTIVDPVATTTADKEASSEDEELDPDDALAGFAATSPKTSKKALKAAARRRKAERKRRTRAENQGRTFGFKFSVLGRNGTDAPRGEATEMGLDGEPRLDDSDLDWGDDGPPSRSTRAADAANTSPATASRRARKGADELAILEDYLLNTSGRPGEDGDTSDVDEDEAALRKFVRSMGADGGAQLTLDDLRDIRKMELEDEEMEGAEAAGWETESSDSEDDDEQHDLVLNLAEELTIDDDGSDDEDLELSSSDDDDDDDDAEVAASLGVRGLGYSTPKDAGRRKGKQKAASPSDSDDDDDDDDDDAMFSGRYAWDDEDFDLDPAELKRVGGARARKKLHNAIELGDFSIYDFDDGSGVAPARKGKARRPAGEDAFMDSLQEQWDRDRKKKGDRKRERALARLESEPKSKKEAKKAAKRAARLDGDANGDATDLPIVNQLIRDFIMHQPNAISLPLAPMAKRQRVGVHLLAEAYGLKSKSMGKGDKRFPVLERTTRTRVYGVDEGKIAAIIGVADISAPGDRPGRMQGGGKGKFGALWREFAGVSKGAGGKKHREGSLVGHGAEEIGATNVGYQLLAKMGWTEGATIGMTGGISAPIGAVIKTSKGGLGMISRF